MIFSKLFKALLETLINQERMRILLNGDQNRQMSMLIMHFYVLVNINQNSSPLDVFKSIFDHPDQYTKAYLPSIPHDDDYEAFHDFNSTNKEGKVKFYRCPNGHIYSIGDCTAPAVVGVMKNFYNLALN